MIEVDALSPEQAREAWPDLEPMIAKALRRTEIDKLFSPFDILFDIAQNKRHLWICHEGKTIHAAIVTQINVYPRGIKDLNVFLIGGSKMDLWFATAEQKLEAWARKAGCKLMSGGGRTGWVRRAGYKIKGVVLIKELA